MIKKPSIEIIPLESNSANNWMCWVNGLMIFLAIFFVAGSLLFQGTVSLWQNKAQHGFTIEIPPADSPQAMASDIIVQQRIFELLRKTSGVRNYHVVSKSTIHSTTDLTNNDHAAATPTPIVIDVETHPTVEVNLDQLQDDLLKIAPGSDILKTREWQSGLIKIADGVFSLGILLTALVCGITLIIVIFSTYTGLVIHQKIVHTLIQLGATRGFIASYFQKHAVQTTLLSSFIGEGFCLLATIIAFIIILQNDWNYILSAVPLGSIILSMIGIPCTLIVLAIVMSHITVYVTIKRKELC